MSFWNEALFLNDSSDIPDILLPRYHSYHDSGIFPAFLPKGGQYEKLVKTIIEQQQYFTSLYTIDEMEFYPSDQGPKLQCELNSHVMIGAYWETVVRPEFERSLKRTLGFVRKERSEYNNYKLRYDKGEDDGDVKLPIFPPEHLVFSWTWYCRPDDVKVVILGDHPYCSAGQDHGLAFSLPPGYIPTHETLVRKVFEALRFDYDRFQYNDGNLINWAAQGVLLLNRRLTVREGEPDSYRDCGWDIFTNNIIGNLSVNLSHIVFMLWGEEADSNKTKYFIDENKHRVLTADSPTKPGGNFKQCKHFSKANRFLRNCRLQEVNWSYL